MAVGEALRRLCEEIGWSYAVFWKAIGAADPVHLVWEDGYCGHTPCLAGSEATELGCDAAVDTICSLVRKSMASQVHIVGEGTVGRAAFTGNHQWIVHSTADDHGLSSEVASEMHCQFRAGIKTIAIIPVLPRGVLQLGSTGVVTENTSFVMHAKKLCSQLNQRSSMAVSASAKSTSSQLRSLHGTSNIHTADSSSKIFSQFPATREQYRHADIAIASSRNLVNASWFEGAQQNARTLREHAVCGKPNGMFVQQVSYCDSRLGSNTNTQSAAVSSGLISSSLASVKQQQVSMNNIGQLEFGRGTDLARNALLKSLAYGNPFIHESTNINLSHGRADLSHGTTGHGSYDFLPGGARVVSANLCTSASSQVSEQGSHSTSGMLLQKQPPVSCNVPQSSEFTMKMLSQERSSFEAHPAVSSEVVVQVSNGLNGRSQENLLSRSGHMHQRQNASGVNDPHLVVSTQGMKNVDSCTLPGIPSETAHSLLLQPTWDNDLFDILGPELHQLCHNVDANLVSWCDVKSQCSDRDAPEPSRCLDSSPLFSSLDNDIPYSGIFSLTDTDQLLDAVISNVNPGGKQSSDDNASCKTTLTDIPSTSHLGLKELKQCDSSGIPPMAIKNESTQIVKQPYYFDKTEDGCLSQNNGAQKSQLRLLIENGQNMRCESVSASNSKGLDAPSKSNRKRSRPGESSKSRPKDRQLIQDRIKELREMVPNGAKANRDVTRMEIFLSLVRLLEPNCDGSGAAKNSNNVKMPLGLVHQPVIPATGQIQ